MISSDYLIILITSFDSDVDRFTDLRCRRGDEGEVVDLRGISGRYSYHYPETDDSRKEKRNNFSHTKQN